MTRKPDDPDLARWATLIEELRWAAFLLDREFRLAWASPDLERFLGSPSEEEIGYGRHVLEAFARDAWRRIATPESRRRLVADLAPVVLSESQLEQLDLDSLSEPVRKLLQDIKPQPFTRPIRTFADYVEPGADDDLPTTPINAMIMPLRDENGTFIGALLLGYMDVRPGLVSLLARGDEAMYERMARLVEPAQREGAVLFCDLEGSTELARALPTAEYFRLIRSLWTEIDELVAAKRGVVGKHAGDGATAFFLVDDFDTASGAAVAAIETARTIHDRSSDVFGDALNESCLMRIGLHWGSSLYIGQLVPGGRLDVTALGDAVNECARIQECADPNATLASKELIERLAPDDAAAVGVDPEKVRYQRLSDFAQISEKALVAVGAIPVTPV